MMMQVEQYACNVYTLAIVLELLDEFTRSEFEYCVDSSGTTELNSRAGN